jgi:KDO2-lipid IV(A) lauroyltransferase
MSRPLQQFKNDAIYYAIRALIHLFENISRDIALKFAVVIGEIFALLASKDMQIAIANLNRAYGKTWSENKIKVVARECFIQLARNGADVIHSRKWSVEEFRRLVDVEGMEHFDLALDMKKGIIAITGHIGNFELLAAYFAAVKGIPVSVIGRKLYDIRLDDLIVENREKWGMENIPSDASARRFYGALKSNRTIGVLMDLDSSRISGLHVPFFGYPAKTAAGPVVLGRRSGSPIVPLALFRTPNDKYLLKILPVIEIPNTEDKENDIKSTLIKCNQALETLINHDPTQWAWMHNRWKSKPSSEENVKGMLEEIRI